MVLALSPALQGIVATIVVSAVSLVGIALFSISERAVRTSLLVFVSFSTGALLGDVFLHILPELVEDVGFSTKEALLLLSGMLASFCVEKFIHWHHCHHLPSKDHYHPIGPMTLLADGMHNAVDGILIVSSFLVDPVVGIATTIAVVLHEIPQEIGDYALLLFSGFRRSSALAWNALSGLTAVAGGLLTLVAAHQSAAILAIILPFAAGNLLYIAGSDLIPELQKHTSSRQSIVQFAGILCGIAVMVALLSLE